MLFPGGGGTADIALGIMPVGLWFSVRTSADTFRGMPAKRIATSERIGRFRSLARADNSGAISPTKAMSTSLLRSFGGYLPLTGGTITGGLNVNGLLTLLPIWLLGRVTVHGAGSFTAIIPETGSALAGMGANLNAYIDNSMWAGSVIANPGAVIGGNLEVGGNGNFSTLGCFNNATINGSVSTAYLVCSQRCRHYTE